MGGNRKRSVFVLAHLAPLPQTQLENVVIKMPTGFTLTNVKMTAQTVALDLAALSNS